MSKFFKVALKRQAFEAGVIRRNLSRKELAGQLGISRSYLSCVIYGLKEPSAAMRTRLLKLFTEYSFDDLFNLKENQDAKRNTPK